MSEDTENLSEEPETEEMAESDDFSDGEEDAVSASASMMDGGITGDIAWSIDTSGCLTLKGNGDYDTSDYYWDAERGWSKWQDDIKTAIVEISRESQRQELCLRDAGILPGSLLKTVISVR